MSEYYVHMLNYPVEAESPEEAVREAVSPGPDGMVWHLGGLVFHVTEREADLRPRVWSMGDGECEAKGFGVFEVVDAGSMNEEGLAGD